MVAATATSSSISTAAKSESTISSFSFLRWLAAIVVGLVLGSMANMAIICVNTFLLFPIPDGVTFDDPIGFGNYIASLPWIAFWIVFVAHYSQVLVGGYLAARLVVMQRTTTTTTTSTSSRTRSKQCHVAAHVIGGFTLLGSIVNNIQIPVPVWTWIELIGFPMVAHATAILAERHVRIAQDSKQT